MDGETGTAEEEKDELDIQVEFRREVYRKGLFAKVRCSCLPHKP